MQMKNLRKGDSVTVTEPIEAYYSGFAGNPKVIVQPGQIGTVAEVNVPAVRGNRVFACGDFVLPGVFSGDPRHGNDTWRISANPQQLKRA